MTSSSTKNGAKTNNNNNNNNNKKIKLRGKRKQNKRPQTTQNNNTAQSNPKDKESSDLTKWAKIIGKSLKPDQALWNCALDGPNAKPSAYSRLMEGSFKGRFYRPAISDTKAFSNAYAGKQNKQYPMLGRTPDTSCAVFAIANFVQEIGKKDLHKMCEISEKTGKDKPNKGLRVSTIRGWADKHNIRVFCATTDLQLATMSWAYMRSADSKNGFLLIKTNQKGRAHISYRPPVKLTILDTILPSNSVSTNDGYIRYAIKMGQSN